MRPLFCAFVCVCARLPAFFYILLSLTSLRVDGFCYFSTFSLVQPTLEFMGLKSVYFVNSIIKVKYLPKNGLRTFFKRPYCVAALFKKKKSMNSPAGMSSISDKRFRGPRTSHQKSCIPVSTKQCTAMIRAATTLLEVSRLCTQESSQQCASGAHHTSGCVLSARRALRAGGGLYK